MYVLTTPEAGGEIITLLPPMGLPIGLGQSAKNSPKPPCKSVGAFSPRLPHGLPHVSLNYSGWGFFRLPHVYCPLPYLGQWGNNPPPYKGGIAPTAPMGSSLDRDGFVVLDGFP